MSRINLPWTKTIIEFEKTEYNNCMQVDHHMSRDAPKGWQLGVGGGISKIYRLEIFTAQSIRIIFDPPLKNFPPDLPHFEIKFRNKKIIPKKMQKKNTLFISL